jgi:hypothetical protein
MLWHGGEWKVFAVRSGKCLVPVVTPEAGIRDQIGDRIELSRAKELDPSIAEALRDLQRFFDSGDDELLVPAISPAFSWEEFLANPPKPMKIKERWRLRCLRE